MNKEVLKQVIVESQSFISTVDLTPRSISIEPAGNYVFVGSRRAGKTYTMFQVAQQLLANGTSAEELLYINFEDERLLELQKVENLALIIDAYKDLFVHKPILFLDEIQIVRGWEKFARRLADTGYKIYITGSNAQMLSSEIATTLGGRFIVKEIFPLSFKEYLQLSGVTFQPNWEFSSQRHVVRRLFDDYFYYGGFPEIVNFQGKRMWLESLYQKIFYGDLVARYKIRNEFALKVVIKKLAESVLDEVSFNRIKNIVCSTGSKVGVGTVIEYVKYLEDSWLLFSIKNYLAKVTERETQKKHYFIDNGVLSLFLSKPESILLENLVACRLWQLYGEELYYVRGAREVDFYVPREKVLVQVAYDVEQAATEERELEALIKTKALVDAERLYVITLDTDRVVEYSGQRICFMPVWKWLLL